MKKLAFKNRVMKIGDRLSVILSHSSGNAELYNLAKELYLMTNDLVECIEDKESTKSFDFEKDSQYTEKEIGKKIDSLEKDCKIINGETKKIKSSVDDLLKIVSEHDYVLRPINDLVRKHTEIIDSIKEKVFSVEGGHNE